MTTTATKGPVPGVLLPTVTGPQGPPGQAAINASNQRAASQASLAKIGGRNKRGGAVTVPQIPGDTSGANAVLAQSTGHSVQATANSKYDNQLHSGGKRRTIKGKKRRTIKGKKRRTIKSKKRTKK